MRLTRTVLLHQGETPRSFAERIAAANGVTAWEFSRDMRLNLKALDAGNLAALQALSELAGIDSPQLQPAAIVEREGGLWLGNCKISHHTRIGRNHPRVCALCLQEDLDDITVALPDARPWYRAAWAVPFVLTCPVHRCLLIQPGMRSISSGVPDSIRFEPKWIMHAARSATPLPASRFEDWVAARLAGLEPAAGLLNDYPLYVGAKLANVSGWTVAFRERARWEALTDVEKVEAGAAGFSLTQSSLEQLLGQIYQGWETMCPTEQGGGYKGFMDWLRANIMNPDYANLLAQVRNYAIDHLPIGPGDSFVGPVTRRSLHSIYSASKEYGLHPKRLRKLLLQGGIIGPEAESLSDGSVVFRVEVAKELLAAAAEEITGDDVRAYLGMTRVQWDQIRKAKILEPLFPDNADTLRAYSRAELDRFLASVRYEKDIPKGEGKYALISIERVRKIAVCGYVEIVTLLRNGRLDRVGINATHKGFAGVLVDPYEVKRKISPRSVDSGLTARQAAKRMGVNIDTVHALTSLGILPSFVQRIYRDLRKSRLIRPADVDKFLAEYMPLSELAHHLGVASWPRHACDMMEDHGVVRAFNNESVRTVIYRRADVEPILARI